MKHNPWKPGSPGPPAAPAALILLLLALAGTAAPAPWPGWRGRGNGIAPAADLPVYWTATANIAWKTPFPGQGNSSPILSRNALFLTSATRNGRVRYILCYNPDNGRLRWKTPIRATRKTRTYPKSGYAPSTPVTDGRRVYAFFDSPGLVCARANDGKILWTRDLGPFKTPYNMASSPILCGNRIILVCDVNNGSFIIAMDPNSGRTLWRTPRNNRYSSASPIEITTPTGKQIVVNGKTVIAYRPADGAEIWRCRGMKPYVTPTAVFDGRLVYAVSGRNGPIMGIDPRGRGDVTDSRLRLFLPSGGPYVPSPVLCDGLLFVPGDNGSYRFVDPDRGAVVCRGRLPRGWFSASPLAAGTRIYWSSERGQTYVLDTAGVRAPRRGIRILGINSFGEGILASPAVAGDRLFLRGEHHLFCIRGRLPPPGPVALSGAAPEDFARLKQLYEARKAPSNDDAKAFLRVEIVDALARNHSAPVPDFLCEIAMKDNNWNVCQEAAAVLAAYGPQAVPQLLKLATWKPAQPYLKILAAQGLGRLAGANAVPALAVLAKDGDPLVRIAAVTAIGKIAARRSAALDPGLPLLLRALEDNTETVQAAAVAAVAAIPGKLGKARSRVLKRLQALAAGTNPWLAARARAALDHAFTAPVRPGPASR